MEITELNNLIHQKMNNVHIEEDSDDWRGMYLVAMLAVKGVRDYKVDEVLNNTFVKYQEGKYNDFLKGMMEVK